MIEDTVRKIEGVKQVLPATLVGTMQRKQQETGEGAVMALTYLLQEKHKVPLGYRFTLYSYGPYCPEVRARLEAAIKRGEIQRENKYDWTASRLETGPEYPKLGYGPGNMAIVSYGQEIHRMIEDIGHLDQRRLSMLASAAYMGSPRYGVPRADDRTLTQALNALKAGNITEQESAETVETARRLNYLPPEGESRQEAPGRARQHNDLMQPSFLVRIPPWRVEQAQAVLADMDVTLEPESDMVAVDDQDRPDPEYNPILYIKDLPDMVRQINELLTSESMRPRLATNTGEWSLEQKYQVMLLMISEFQWQEKEVQLHWWVDDKDTLWSRDILPKYPNVPTES